MTKDQLPPPESPSGNSNAALAALAGEAAQLEGGAPASTPGAPEAAPAPEPEIPTAEFLEGMLAPLVMLLPSVHHGFAVKPITPAEVKMLATGWAGVLDHYFPGGVSQLGPWAGALAVTLAVAGPRLVIPAPPKPKPAPTPAPAPASA